MLGICICYVVVFAILFAAAIFLRRRLETNSLWKIGFFLILFLWAYWLYSGMLAYHRMYRHYKSSIEKVCALIVCGEDKEVLAALEKYRHRAETEGCSGAAFALDYFMLKPPYDALQDDQNKKYADFMNAEGEAEHRIFTPCAPSVSVFLCEFTEWCFFLSLIVLIAAGFFNKQSIIVPALCFLLFFTVFGVLFAGHKQISDSRAYGQVFQKIAMDIENGQANETAHLLRQYLKETPSSPVESAHIKNLLKVLDDTESAETNTSDLVFLLSPEFRQKVEKFKLSPIDAEIVLFREINKAATSAEDLRIFDEAGSLRCIKGNDYVFSTMPYIPDKGVPMDGCYVDGFTGEWRMIGYSENHHEKYVNFPCTGLFYFSLPLLAVRSEQDWIKIVDDACPQVPEEERHKWAKEVFKGNMETRKMYQITDQFTELMKSFQPGWKEPSVNE